MITYLKGKLVEKNPAYAVIECGGIGYQVHISLYTYSSLPNSGECTLLTHQIIKEDMHLLFGFITEKERELFRFLIMVNGVGANTARMMLSSLNPDDIYSAIITNNITSLKGVKGIGEKTAQRIVLDLKDKIGKISNIAPTLNMIDNDLKESALSALIMLGFQRLVSEKVINQILKDQKDSITVEDLVKLALKKL